MSKQTKEELEIIKLRQEIKQLKRPVFLRPEFLSIVLSSIFAAATIYFTIVKAESEDLKNKIAENIRLSNQINEIKSLELRDKEQHLQNSIDQLKIKESNLKDSLNIKFQRDLLVLENKLKDIRLYINEYRVGYSNSRLKSTSVINSMEKFVKPEEEKNFRQWFYNELNRAIDISNRRSLDQIELERKISEYNIK